MSRDPRDEFFDYEDDSELVTRSPYTGFDDDGEDDNPEPTPAPRPTTRSSAAAPVQADDEDNDQPAPKKSRLKKLRDRRTAKKTKKAAKKARKSKDGLVRIAHCRVRHVYNLAILAIPLSLFFLAHKMLDYLQTPAGIAAHNPYAHFAAAQSNEHNMTLWKPILIIGSTIIAIILMRLIHNWDINRHFGSPTTTDEGGCVIKTLDPRKVVAKKKVRRARFTCKVIFLGIIAVIIFWVI